MSDTSKLIGREYGLWTIIDMEPVAKRGDSPVAVCRCGGCGLIVRVKTVNLYNGKSTQCLACSMRARIERYTNKALREAAGQVSK